MRRAGAPNTNTDVVLHTDKTPREAEQATDPGDMETSSKLDNALAAADPPWCKRRPRHSPSAGTAMLPDCGASSRFKNRGRVRRSTEMDTICLARSSPSRSRWPSNNRTLLT